MNALCKQGILLTTLDKYLYGYYNWICKQR